MTRKENILRAFACEETEWIPIGQLDQMFLSASAFCERSTGPCDTVDDFGVEWVFVPGINADMPKPGVHVISDLTRWPEQLRLPDVDSRNWKACAAHDLAPIDRDASAIQVTIFNGLFERLHALCGFEDALAYLLTEPEAVEDFFTALTEYRCQQIRRIGKFYRPEHVCMHDDWGNALNMFMSPAVWRKLIKPHIEKIVNCAHESGMRYYQHSCGYITPIVGDLAELGVDMLDPLQGCNDIESIKRNYGKRICLCGGFDNQHILDIPSVSREDKCREIERVLDIMTPGGGYVSGCICVDFSSVYLINEAVHKRNAAAYRRWSVEYPEVKTREELMRLRPRPDPNFDPYQSADD